MDRETESPSDQGWWSELWRRLAYPTVVIRRPVPLPVRHLPEPRDRSTVPWVLIQVADVVISLREFPQAYVWKNRWGDRDLVHHLPTAVYHELRRRSWVYQPEGRDYLDLFAGSRLVFLSTVERAWKELGGIL